MVEARNWSKLLDAADLSVGRQFEGHANAIDLVNCYGTNRQFKTLAHAIGKGAITGVWGADGRGKL